MAEPMVGRDIYAYEAVGPGPQQQTPEHENHADYWAAQSQAQTAVDTAAQQLESKGLDPTSFKLAADTVKDRIMELDATLADDYVRGLEEAISAQEKRVVETPSTQRDSVRSAWTDIDSRLDMAITSGDMEGIRFAEEEVDRLWERAARVDDRGAMRAIGQWCIERGISSGRERYLDAFNKRDAWDQYSLTRQRKEDFFDPKQAGWRRISGSQGLRIPPSLR